MSHRAIEIEYGIDKVRKAAALDAEANDWAVHEIPREEWRGSFGRNTSEVLVSVIQSGFAYEWTVTITDQGSSIRFDGTRF